MAFNQMGQSRDVGLSHGPGKGSAPRNNSSKAFRSNFDEIDWGGGLSFAQSAHPYGTIKRKGPGRFIKRYK